MNFGRTIQRSCLLLVSGLMAGATVPTQAQIYFNPDVSPGEPIQEIQFTLDQAPTEVNSVEVEIRHDRVIFRTPGANYEALRIGDNRDREVYVFGSSHRDIISISGQTTEAFLIVLGFEGNDTIDNNSGNRMQCDAGTGNDFIQGGSGPDILMGDQGKDEIRGGGGNDKLHGGPGSDLLDGQAGDDVLIGGDGYYPPGTKSTYPAAIPDLYHDVLTGGSGRDWFFDRYYDYRESKYGTNGLSSTLSKAGTTGSKPYSNGTKFYYAEDTVTDYRDWEDTKWDSFFPMYYALKNHVGFLEAD